MNYKLYIIAAILTGLFKVQGQDIASNKDTITIPEILVTSNRIHMSPMLAPNKIQVMSEKYISKLNGDKLSDVLTNSDAAFIKDYGFNSGMKTISLNATQSEHALILLNGVKLNSPENAQFDAALLQMNDVNRIEISNGGSSSLYGSEAIGGIINIVSNDFLYQKAFNIDISNTIGSYGFNKLYVGTGSSLIFSGNKLLNLRVSYSNENSKNNYQYYSFNGFSNELKERFNNDYRANTFNLDAAYTLSRTSSIRLFSLYSSWNRGVPGPDFGFSSAEARQIDNNLVSSISFNKTFFGDKEIKTSLNYKYSLMKYYDPLTYNTSSPINDFYKINSIINNSEINLFKNTKHEVTSGYELSYNNLLSNEVDKSKETQIGIYSAAKLEINKLLDKIIFYPSVRYDYFSDINKNVFTGKIGLNLKPFRKANFTLKSSISNNFRAPTFNELYWIGLGNNEALAEHQLAQAKAALGNEAEDHSRYARPVVKQAEAALEAAKLDQTYTKITAPFAGIVTRKSAHVGNRVQVGEPLLAVVPLGKLYVTANFKETQLTDVRVGQKAEVAADIYPGYVYQAHVDSISMGTGAAFSLLPPENATGNWVKVVQRVPVKVVLDQPAPPDKPLRLGLSVEVAIDLGDRHGALLTSIVQRRFQKNGETLPNESLKVAPMPNSETRHEAEPGAARGEQQHFIHGVAPR